MNDEAFKWLQRRSEGKDGASKGSSRSPPEGDVSWFAAPQRLDENKIDNDVPFSFSKSQRKVNDVSTSKFTFKPQPKETAFSKDSRKDEAASKFTFKPSQAQPPAVAERQEAKALAPIFTNTSKRPEMARVAAAGPTNIKPKFGLPGMPVVAPSVALPENSLEKPSQAIRPMVRSNSGKMSDRVIPYDHRHHHQQQQPEKRPRFQRQTSPPATPVTTAKKSNHSTPSTSGEFRKLTFFPFYSVGLRPSAVK